MDKNSFFEENERIRHIYEQRDRLLPRDDWETNVYHPRHPLGLLLREHNFGILINALNSLKINLIPMRILDFGCGYGYWLRYFVELGAVPGNLTGVDLSRQRVDFARAANPSINWIYSEEMELPLASETFDLVTQAVVFSSITNNELRENIAKEMLRVTKPGGYILWLDHRQSLSDNLCGFSKNKVLTYFPGSTIVYETPAHPRYFRRMFTRCPNLCRLFYSLSKCDCDSWFLIMKKGGAQSD